MNIVTRTLQRFGLVRTSRYVAAIEQQRKAEMRTAALRLELDKHRAVARGWKNKADGLGRALKQAQNSGRRAQAEAGRARDDLVEAQRDARRAQSAAARSQRDAAKRIERLEKTAARAQEQYERLHGEVAPLIERLTAAERDLAAAHENLMAIEVKLDILEGAASVLDRRTRVGVVQQSRPGAPV